MLQAALLLEQQDPEAVKAGIAQRLAILRDVATKTAGTAGARHDEHVAVDDLLWRQTLRVQLVQALDQVADVEIGRVALAPVAELFAKL